MRTMTVRCDVCGQPVEKFNGAVTLASWGSLHKDACSPKCLCALLRGFAADIEKREKMKAADNEAFAAQHPEATSVVAPAHAYDPSAPSMTGRDNMPSVDLRGVTSDPKPAALTSVTQAEWEAANPRMAAARKEGLAAAAAAGVPVVVHETPGPTPVGCAACSVGVPFNTETAFRHTGEGEHCKTEAKDQGPCACSPEHWKMESPPEVVCTKCGNMWTAKIKPENMPAATGKRGGRPKGSKNKPKENGAETNGTAATNGAANASVAETPENKAQRDESMGRAHDTSPLNEMERLAAQRAQEDAQALRGPGSAFSPPAPPVVFPTHTTTQAPAGPTGPLFDTSIPADLAPTIAKGPLPLARDMSIQEAPRWCSCGKPLTWTKAKAWECEDHGPHGMPMNVKQGLPGENLSQLVTQAEKHGVKLNLIDVAQWTVLQRDALRAWIAQGGDNGEFPRPVFLPAAPPPPPPVAAPEAAKPRFTF
jgi:hypothetical protein